VDPHVILAVLAALDVFLLSIAYQISAKTNYRIWSSAGVWVGSTVLAVVAGVIGVAVAWSGGEGLNLGQMVVFVSLVVGLIPLIVLMGVIQVRWVGFIFDILWPLLEQQPRFVKAMLRNRFTRQLVPREYRTSAE